MGLKALSITYFKDFIKHCRWNDDLFLIPEGEERVRGMVETYFSKFWNDELKEKFNRFLDTNDFSDVNDFSDKLWNSGIVEKTDKNVWENKRRILFENSQDTEIFDWETVYNKTYPKTKNQLTKSTVDNYFRLYKTLSKVKIEKEYSRIEKEFKALAYETESAQDKENAKVILDLAARLEALEELYQLLYDNEDNIDKKSRFKPELLKKLSKDQKTNKTVSTQNQTEKWVRFYKSHGKTFIEKEWLSLSKEFDKLISENSKDERKIDELNAKLTALETVYQSLYDKETGKEKSNFNKNILKSVEKRDKEQSKQAQSKLGKNLGKLGDLISGTGSGINKAADKVANTFNKYF